MTLSSNCDYIFSEFNTIIFKCQNDHNPSILEAKGHWYGGIGALAKKIFKKILSLHRHNVQKVQQK